MNGGRIGESGLARFKILIRWLGKRIGVLVDGVLTGTVNGPLGVMMNGTQRRDGMLGLMECVMVGIVDDAGGRTPIARWNVKELHGTGVRLPIVGCTVTRHGLRAGCANVLIRSNRILLCSTFLRTELWCPIAVYPFVWQLYFPL